MNFNSTDIRYMQYALQVAKMGQGETWPNPAVGCVIVSNFDSKKKKPAIIGTGHTSKGGVPHAEIMAMNSANKNLDGATLYVTLEPCCHIGKSKPCTQSIIKNNLKRVVIAMVDPNPLVAGKGIQELKKNSIEVV
ncbi:MAG: bifunctional diaminohydroxyphosphoribosylaminopyrimidine deaminase/5-amino-6-(5-phosphoribosylamino)uracil reductase RibD, partial [Pseudomonadota bacterium]|nr:bifunctional diaminohydroxyphosphoribosylaminopyrimidine deaminase/5-amino-6-(5-phosphoribosylamino)uracil reductase RibD [Pseudomonadota bacterium]